MTDPKRWLDDSTAELGLERALVKRGVELEPGPGAVEETWALVAAKIGPGGPAGGGPDAGAGGMTGGEGALGAATGGGVVGATGGGVVGATAAHGVGTGLIGGFAVGVAVSVAAVGIEHVVDNQAPDVAQVAASAAPGGVHEPVKDGQPVGRGARETSPSVQQGRAKIARIRAADRGESTPSEQSELMPTDPGDVPPPPDVGWTPEPLPQGQAAFPEALPASGSERPAAGRLRQEARALAHAKNALGANRAGEALALLADQSQRFPRGELAHEREALTIQSLMRLGRTQEARMRADAFVRRNPQSPVSNRIRALVGK